MKQTPSRSRTTFFILIIITIFAGLASREYSYLLSTFIGEYSGDILWALMVYFIIRFIFIEYTVFQVAVISLSFSFLIEFSQLYQAGWINAIRHTRIGGLVLGYGFLWSDLLCYTAGILLGMILDKIVFNIKQRDF
ncbi:MAG TPA: DUF2809 domain-containing protein [Ignavibacteria bacterium]|nr:DUF2809 domain-containing protein [Ignavibacteria bacterium]HMR41569.1 DUF2809 domain-containing protein [Ignavibacteria bacterium]